MATKTRCPGLIGDLDKTLLERGYTLPEIAEQLGATVDNLRYRNRVHWKVNIHTAFKARLEREGIPSRLSIKPDFGHWFSGLFDGEGCLVAWHNPKNGHTHMNVQLSCRVDDEQMLNYIQAHLGGITRPKPTVAPSRPQTIWKIGNLKDLMEVVVPLFDQFPLHSKKAREYILWRELIVGYYIATLGGLPGKNIISMPNRELFNLQVKRLCQEIHAIRFPWERVVR